jgi:anthranilate phosphoribosyltransferase
MSGQGPTSGLPIREALAIVVQGKNLSASDMTAVVGQIMDGAASPAQVGALLAALRMKGETVDEVVGAAQAMRQRMVRVETDIPVLLDNCGTGGDGSGSVNVSTLAALILAGCGVKVAKHGNRSVSSACGSADVLERLGINLDVTPETVERCVREIGIGFLFAPALHGAMKHAIGPRREIGIRTIFNILGPLTNPAAADCQVMGVYRADLVEKLAGVLHRLGCRHGFVVHGTDGMDEMTLTAETMVAEVTPAGINLSTVTPEQLGLVRCQMQALKGGDAVANADIVRAILAGEKGPRRDIVLLNAAYALLAANKTTSALEGLALAAEAIDTGRALEQVNKLAEMTATA